MFGFESKRKKEIREYEKYEKEERAKTFAAASLRGKISDFEEKYEKAVYDLQVKAKNAGSVDHYNMYLNCNIPIAGSYYDFSLFDHIEHFAERKFDIKKTINFGIITSVKNGKDKHVIKKGQIGIIHNDDVLIVKDFKTRILVKKVFLNRDIGYEVSYKEGSVSGVLCDSKELKELKEKAIEILRK